MYQLQTDPLVTKVLVNVLCRGNSRIAPTIIAWPLKLILYNWYNKEAQ